MSTIEYKITANGRYFDLWLGDRNGHLQFYAMYANRDAALTVVQLIQRREGRACKL